MTLKTSSFKINKTIFKKNIVRFWPIWILYTIIWIFVLPVNIFSSVSYLTEDWGAGYMLYKTQNFIQALNYAVLPVLAAAFAILAAVAVFSYLYSGRSCNMMHAFPVKRTELFVTNYISGFLFLAVPQVIAAIFAKLVCVNQHVAHSNYVWIWLLIMLGLSFFFYSVAVFCSMLTGNYFAGIAYFVLFNVIYVVVAALFLSLADQLCYGIGSVYDLGGYDEIPGMFLSPLFYLQQSNVLHLSCTITNDTVFEGVFFEGGSTVVLYCVAGAVFIILSVLLYKKRHLETASEIAAYQFVKPLIRWMVTIAASMGLAYWFTVVFFEGNLLYLPIWIVSLVVLSWAIFFVSEMIINKKFRIFKKMRFVEWAICIAAMLLMTGFLEGDVFGIESRMPQASEIKGISVTATHEMLLTEQEEIEEMLAIHQQIIDEKNQNEWTYYTDGKTEYIAVEYVLADGDILKRSYNVPTDEAFLADESSTVAKVRALQMDTDSYLRSWLLDNYEGINWTGSELCCFGETGEKYVEISQEDTQIIYQAMLKDIAEDNTHTYFGSDDWEEASVYYSSHLILRGTIQEKPVEIYTLIQKLFEENKVSDEDAEPIYYTEEEIYYYEKGPDGYMIERFFDLQGQCTHTIQALIDLEIIESAEDLAAEY